MVNTINEYNPDYIIHPGEYILELIEAIGISQTEFATRIDITPKHLSNIINGKAGITANTAKSLQIAYNYDPQYWLSLQSGYDIAVAEREKNEEYKNNENENKKWLEHFDYKEIVKLGFIEEIYDSSTDIGKINNLLSYFNFSDINGWNSMYVSSKMSSKSIACRIIGASETKFGNTAAWIRYGQIKANEISINFPPYDKNKFKENLLKIREMTKNLPEDFSNKMESLCKEAGVFLLFVKEIPGAGMCGAAFWENNRSIPCIQMSLRYKKNDHFWFTFFHEAGHILNEHKKDICLDYHDLNSGEKDIEEKANTFASNVLIHPSKYKEFINETNRFSKDSIIQFANSIGVHPGIVVGRLQHDGKLKFSFCKDLKHSIVWAN